MKQCTKTQKSATQHPLRVSFYPAIALMMMIDSVLVYLELHVLFPFQNEANFLQITKVVHEKQNTDQQ